MDILALRNALLLKMEDVFGDDTKRINHARKVLAFTEQLLDSMGGDPDIVIPAAILHDIGITRAEKIYGSQQGHLQEKEGARIARKILEEVSLQKDQINEICDIITYHHTPGVINTANFKVLFEADSKVNRGEIPNT